ncbi:YybH family protein [Agarilytica rhodophyticola]|uniref:YybH family protein n=1 Tax=Agarilytica rhodophyticola TaxID=1737490 RepID=UPI000B3464B9|nr:nuclear transport factor 2 family protein [Agarilytica rhodophyticola]
MIQDDNEITKVRENLASWLRAFNAKNMDSLFSLYDPNSLYANANAPLMRGIEQIKPWYQEALANVQGELLYREEAAIQDGNLAMLLGAYYFKPPHEIAPPSDAKLTGGTGRVALVYKRNQEGDWKLLFDMDNTPPDISPETFLQPTSV